MEHENYFVQHIPNCCQGFTPRELAFTSLDELLNFEWIKKWIDGEKQRNYFHQISISKDEWNPEKHIFYLMIELDEGHEWWVLGRLKKDILELPRWKSKEKRKKETK